MSQFVVADIRIENLDTLKEVLESIGFEGKIEIHDTPQKLVGYMGDERRQDAEVIVRRQNLQGSSNDLGFRWNEKKGCYDMIVSDYDTRVGHAVKQAHALHRLKSFAKNNRRRLTIDEGQLPKIQGRGVETQKIKIVIQ